ncbi:MAG: hypothetical protein QOF84_7063 [Streptomyces sp.]|nr:hypothetical protein [Streptomyces sp.]
MPEARFEVEEMLDAVPVRLPAAKTVRARGEQRRMRKRVGVAAMAVVAAAAVGAGTWMALPGGTEKAQVSKVTAPPRPDPYWSHGADGNYITAAKPSALPLYAEVHWKQNDHSPSADTTKALPGVGIGTACGPWVNPVPTRGYGFSSGTVTYSGKGGAKARHRVVAYESLQGATKSMSQTEKALAECGLTVQRKDDVSASYAGTAKDGTPLTVTLDQYDKVVSVIEVQGVEVG